MLVINLEHLNLGTVLKLYVDNIFQKIKNDSRRKVSDNFVPNRRKV